MIHRFRLLLNPPDIDEAIIRKGIRQTNLTRSLVMSCIAFLVSFTIINFSYAKFAGHSVQEMQWRNAVLVLNTYMILFNSIFISVTLYLYYKKTTDHILYTFVPYILLLELGIWGIIGSSLHQLISWTIVPFILVVFAASVLLIRPAIFFYYFIILYLCFFFCIGIYQTNPEYIILNRSLGLAAIAISYFFSLVFWNNSLLRFRQERLIELQTKKLLEADASKNKFFSILSHDLKGPLSSSLSLSEMLSEDHLDENERKELQAMFSSSLVNILRLIDNVLLWANNQTGNINFNPSPIHIKELIEENIQLAQPMAKNKSIILVNHSSEDYLVYADLHMMHTVLRNLLSNAIKFTHENGTIEIFVDQVKNTASPATHIQISVLDNGIGMSNTFVNDLFKLHKKTLGVGTNDEIGTGLGLILCKDFIEKNQGRLTVESIKNSGSRFTFTLPLIVS